MLKLPGDLPEPAKSHSPAKPAKAPPRIKPLYVLGAFCLASVVVIGFQLLTAGSRGEGAPLRRDEYDAALKLWEAKRPANYDVDAEFFSNNMPVDIHLEVRGGKIAVMTKNGARVAQESRRAEWSVDRMMQTIGQDLHTQEDPNLDFDVRAGVRVELKAEFDKEYGYPKLYRRLATGSPINYSYDITRFTPIN